jgi:4-aminobutyrate aminotransferase-like enzyme
VIRLLPPLVATEEEIDFAVEVIAKAMPVLDK